MAHIRSFSVEGPEQDEFKHTFLKVIENFIKELPSMDVCELAEDEDGRCMICQHEYRSGNRNARLNGAEEAVCLPCELFPPSPFFLIRIAFGVARHVAGAKSSWDVFHDSDLIPEEIC